MVEFGVLGPVEACLDGKPLPLGGPKPRALLAMLVLRANEVVPRDRLIEGLWGGQMPASAEHGLDDYVSRLRKVIGADRLERSPPGYVLHVEPGELDLDRFEELCERARGLSSRGDPRGAADALTEALALWRGAALADLIDEPFAPAEIERLGERRLLAIEDLAEARLASGEGAELVGELTRLVDEHPYRERPVGELMLALYRAGRQAEALSVYRRARLRFADELGLEPGPELRELERRILQHDPALGVQTALRSRPRRRPTRRVAAVVACLVVAAAALVALLPRLGHGGSAGATVRRDEIVGLSPSSGGTTAGVALAGPSDAIGPGADALWVADGSLGEVSRIDLSSRSVVDRVPVGGSPGTVAVGGGYVWVASVPGGSIARIDPSTDTLTQTISLAGAQASSLAYGEGGLWVADTTDDSLIELDPKTGGVLNTVPLDLTPTSLAVGDGGVWVADYETNTVEEIDPRSGQALARIGVGDGPSALTLGPGAVWVANTLDSTVTRIDPTKGSVAFTIRVGNSPAALALTPGGVWVANRWSYDVWRIDPARNVVTRTIPIGGQPTALAAAAGRLWIGITPAVEHRGGTLVLLHTRPVLLDPALQGDITPPQSDGLTRDVLVTFNHVGGAAGVQLVPDLALKVPTPTDGDTTYTFRLLRGVRYSDGRLVRAGDFRRAIERDFDLRSYGTDLLDGIRGSAACLPHGRRPIDCNLAGGIVTNNAAGTVTIHLAQADPYFLLKLTNGGLAAPVPPGTPMHRSPRTPIPGTGPYEVAFVGKREIRYVRNPYFHEWSHAAQPAGNPDQIIWRFGLSAAAEVRLIEQGRADWMADPIPASLIPSVKARRSSELHSFQTTETDFFQLNAGLPPFNSVRARRALNLAIDRRTIERIVGGTLVATPTCQMLPAGVRGYRHYCPYTSAPDLVRAERLVAESGTRGDKITVWGWSGDPLLGRALSAYTARVLDRLGYRARVRLISHEAFDALPPAVQHSVQLIPTGIEDSTPYGFLWTWFACDSPNSGGYFCNRHDDTLMRRALDLENTNPRAAAALWTRVDHALVDQAASVPLVNERQVDFVSPHVRNFEHNPYWDVLVDQLELR